MSLYRFRNFEFDSASGRLSGPPGEICLRPKTARLLEVLLQAPGRVLSQRELFDAVWGDVAITQNSLSQSVSELRRVLDDLSRSPRFIETLAGRGYRWLPEVESSGVAGAAAANRRRRIAWARVGLGAGLLTALLAAFGLFEREAPAPPRVEAAGRLAALEVWYTRGPLATDAYLAGLGSAGRSAAWSRLLAARSMYHAGRWNEAVAVAQSLLREVPEGDGVDAGARSLLGRIAWHRGELALADELLTRSSQGPHGSLADRVATMTALADLRAAQGRVAEYLALRAAASELLQRGEGREQEDLLALADLGIATTLNPVAQADAGRERLTAARRRLRGSPSRWRRAVVELAVAGAAGFPLDERHQAATEARQILEELGDRIGVARAWSAEAALYTLQLDGEGARRCLREAEAVFAAVAADHELARLEDAYGLADLALVVRGPAAQRSEALRRGIAHLTVARDRLADIGSEFDRLAAELHLGLALREASELDEAEALLSRLVESYEALEFWPGRAGAAMGLIAVAIDRGRYRQALGELDRLSISTPQVLGWTRRLAARCHYELGAYREAASCMHGARELLGDLWSAEDSHRLGVYEAAADHGRVALLTSREELLAPILQSE
jgi:DNA-binding winged helix-turn-helix (wHTH) protein